MCCLATWVDVSGPTESKGTEAQVFLFLLEQGWLTRNERKERWLKRQLKRLNRLL